MYKYYTCFDCGGQVLVGGRGCLPCLQQKTLKRMADDQEAENRRSREREREREREAYYERMRQRDAEREADPEYQARMAHQRELKRQQEIDRQFQIAEARRIEQERWDALTPEEQAAEIELKNKRQQLADAKLEFEREKYTSEKQQSDNFDFGLKTVLWVGYAGLLYWVFTSLIPAMFKSLTLLALPLGAMVLILAALPGIYLIAFSAKD